MIRKLVFYFFLVLLIGNVYAITINDIAITPNLDISFFGNYKITANISNYPGNDVNVLVSAINGDGGACWDYFVDGTCSGGLHQPIKWIIMKQVNFGIIIEYILIPSIQK
jgi:hypothetical protein